MLSFQNFTQLLQKLHAKFEIEKKNNLIFLNQIGAIRILTYPYHVEKFRLKKNYMHIYHIFVYKSK